MFDLLILGGIVVTVDDAHTLYDPGFVAVKGDKIALIGPMEALPEGATAARTIDASGHAVMPGLIDGHGHAGHCLIKSLGEQYSDWGGMAEDIYFHYTDPFFWQAEAALAAAERLKFGITTGVSMLGSTPRPDSLELLEAHFDGARPVGIRQVSGIGFCDGPWPKHPWQWQPDGSYREVTLSPEEAVANTERSVRELNGKHPRQICIPAPGSIGHQRGADDALSAWANREMGRIAREYGLPMHTHSHTGSVQFAYDTTPEVFTENSSWTHSTGLTPEEIGIFAETGACVFHGPTTHANETQRCPVYELIRAGANVAIVTDGTAPDRSYDIWRDMKVFHVIHRIHEQDGTLAPPGMILEMCTRKPAKALGMADKIGSLEVGKQADIILVDMLQPHLVPTHLMTVPRLVYHAQGQDVVTVIVDGEIMMENRRLTGCDEAKILADADRALEALFSRMGPDKVRPLVREDGIYDIQLKKY